MKLHYCSDHIVRFKNGDLWHFFSKKGQGIYFRKLEKNGVWGNDIDLITNTHENFSLSIDSQSNLYIICQGHNGEIIYMKYNGKTWNKQLLYQYDPSRYTIQFPSIILLNDRIHVLFTIGTAPSTGIWSIYHCYQNDKDWIKDEIARYTDGKQTNPFYIDADPKNIHLIYRSPHQNQHHIFYCRFDDSRKRWSKVENLSRNLAECNMPSILVKNNKLHLTWTSIKNSNLQVMYRSWNLTSYSKTNWEKEVLLSGDESNCLDPQLFWADNQLWCMWYQNNDIYFRSSSDEGINWNPIKCMEWSHIDNCFCIKYLSSYPMEQSAFKVHRIFANLDNGLRIPILEEYMNLPKAIYPVEHMHSNSTTSNSSNLFTHTTVESITVAKAENAVKDTESPIHEYTTQACGQTAEKEENKQIQDEKHTGEFIPDNVITHILALIEEINKTDSLKAKFQSFIAKTQAEEGSSDHFFKLNAILNSWIKKAEEVQVQNQAIMREIEALRRRCIENQRQWEILLEEFEEIKALLGKNLRKGLLSKIIG